MTHAKDLRSYHCAVRTRNMRVRLEHLGARGLKEHLGTCSSCGLKIHHSPDAVIARRRVVSVALDASDPACAALR